MKQPEHDPALVAEMLEVLNATFSFLRHFSDLALGESGTGVRNAVEAVIAKAEGRPIPTERSEVDYIEQYIKPAARKMRADVLADCTKHGIDGEKMLAELRIIIQ